MKITTKEVLVELDVGSSGPRALQEVATGRSQNPAQAIGDLLMASRKLAQAFGMSELDYLTLFKAAGTLVPLAVAEDDALALMKEAGR